MTCEVFLSTPPVGYSGSPSTVNETYCNKKKMNRPPKNVLHELHQLLNVSQSHHESLEEECHLLYCCGDIGSAISSPGSRWRRFSSETAARKSGRSRIGAFFARLIDSEIPLSLVSFEFLFGETVRVILLCQLVHLYALLLGPANFEL